MGMHPKGTAYGHAAARPSTHAAGISDTLFHRSVARVRDCTNTYPHSHGRTKHVAVTGDGATVTEGKDMGA